MTDEQMRIKLTEWDGWTEIHYDIDHKPNGYAEKYLGGYDLKGMWHDVPDYLNDLNAVHELEMKLKFSERLHYTVHLQETMGDGKHIVALSHLAFATAHQRCEALLKTLGLWEDNDDK